MRFVIVVAVILAVAVAASQQGAADGDVADNTVVAIDDVIGGADYTLEALLDGRVTGLSEHSINGVQGVALTNTGYLAGFPTHVQAILIGLFDSIPEDCKYHILNPIFFVYTSDSIACLVMQRCCYQPSSMSHETWPVCLRCKNLNIRIL